MLTSGWYIDPVDAPSRSPEPEPFEELLRDQARLRILLGVAFDYSWEMTLEGDGNLLVHVLQDPSADLGLSPGEFRRTLTAREWIQMMDRDDDTPIDRVVQWLARRREVYQREYRIRRGSGGHTWWEER